LTLSSYIMNDILGSIAFEEERISDALDSWKKLIANYPNSYHAQIISGRIEELAIIVGESPKERLNNTIALSYLRQGDFWSKGKSNIFNIDASWIANVDAAINWYDKVIIEFPGSIASRIAYESKIRTLIGWEENGR